MVDVVITRDKYPAVFGGIGFHNNEAALYKVIDTEHFNQVLCKNYREMAPGFMRTFAGYDDWTKKAMDDFAEYYEKMQKWTDTPMYFAAAFAKLHFSDEEIDEYCETVAKNLKYLIEEKKVKHLRYYCFSNEMSQRKWGYLLNDLPLFKKYHERLYRAFQNNGINVGLLATDASEYENWKTMDWAIENMSRITEHYCLHVYERKHDIYDLDFYDFFYKKCSEQVYKAIADYKKFIIGEFGINRLTNTNGPGVVEDVCRYFECEECAFSGLMLAEMIFAAINAGVFAMAYWSYTDYPDPYMCSYAEKDEYAKKWGECEKFISGTTGVKYNRWGLLKWTDEGDYSAKDVYWCVAPIVKYFKSNSRVLNIKIEDSLLRSCGVISRNGNVTIGIVNRHKDSVKIKLDSNLFNKDIRVIEYDTNNVPRNKFGDIQMCSCQLEPNNPTYELKPSSMTIFTTDYLTKEKSVYADGIRFEGNRLKWNAVDEPEHCYYRVFADENSDFQPTIDNQIASTVAEEIPIKTKELFYKVLSVDNSGNI
ncbi:MAG: hypothetical protein IKK03_12280 [Lachnospiraceae bacterium]|nr:hypothetical protein [Lachnospiraceae bacterium]